MLWQPHIAVLGRLLGVNWFTKLITTLLLVGESALPIYLIFDHRLKKLGKQLFDRTLQIKLGTAAAPAGATSHSDALAAVKQSPAAVQRTASVAPLPAQDAQVLSRMLTKHRQEQAAAQQKRGLLGAAFALAMRLVFKPSANENFLIRKGRDFVTLGISALIPGAAVLLPFLMYADSSAEVATLMSRYYEHKGVTEADAHDLLAQQHMSEMRGFGLVAAALSYVPVLNWALSLSNHVAAALYAAHMEAKGASLVKMSWL